MIVDAWSVVVVPFPFADRPVSKRRPAVALSLKMHNEAHGVTSLAMITTARGRRWNTDVPVTGLIDAGLREPCVVRPRIGTVDNELIDRVIGSLSQADRRALRKGIERLFGWT